MPTVLPLIQEQYYRNHNSSQSKDARNTKESPRKKEGIKGDVYVMIPPKPFQRGPPLNSMAFLRLKSTKKKHRETSSSIGSDGHRIFLCLDMRYLKCSMHTISPQMHCHQSPKPLREKYALTARTCRPLAVLPARTCRPLALLPA